MRALGLFQRKPMGGGGNNCQLPFRQRLVQGHGVGQGNKVIVARHTSTGALMWAMSAVVRVGSDRNILKLLFMTTSRWAAPSGDRAI